MHQSGKQLILTCDKAPAELEGMEDRLLSRFRWGLSAEIKAPDFDTRKEIVLNKARKDGIDFSEEVIEYICKYVDHNVRELEGAMISLLAQSTFNKRDLTVDVVRDILGKMVKKPTIKSRKWFVNILIFRRSFYRRKPENVRWYKPVNWLCISVKTIRSILCRISVAKSVKKIMLRSYTPAKRSPT